MSAGGVNIAAIVGDQTTTWQRERPAESPAILSLRENSPVRLPQDYLDFLACSNGGCGALPVSPLWFVLWRAEEVLERNKGYQRDEFYPDLFLIGSSGGGCLIGFELEANEAGAVVSMDWLDSQRECVDHLGDSFTDCARLFGRGDNPEEDSIEIDELM
jgi:hypothetical protein